MFQQMVTFRAVWENFSNPMAYQTDQWVGLKCRCNRSQFSRCSPIVAVEERNNFSAALWNLRVERRCLPAVRFAQQAHFGPKLLYYFRRAVGRTVVHYKNLALRRSSDLTIACSMKRS